MRIVDYHESLHNFAERAVKNDVTSSSYSSHMTASFGITAFLLAQMRQKSSEKMIGCLLPVRICSFQIRTNNATVSYVSEIYWFLLDNIRQR
jgi:hypothetical protein